jgi:hypothetical protein
VFLLCVTLPADAQPALPIIDDVPWRPLRAQCSSLLKALDEAHASLPAETVRRLQALLDAETKNPETAIRTVQELLDPHCLIAVSINPESRVKATRGPGFVGLRQDQPMLVLIKVHNDAGVTHRLRVSGPELRHGRESGAGRWLQTDLVTEPPFGAELSGQRVEYRLLRLTPRESGKREATFQFDVGQGTQDLGFRAEVPILFSVHPPRRDG